MTSYVENETSKEFSFEPEDVVKKVAMTVLEMENCPYEACLNLLITDNRGIRAYNKEYRQIDKETDVLSFPNVEYEKAGDFSLAETMQADCFDPENGELILGDIIISAEKIETQAKEYGHSELREFAFLVAHSLFHLCGYDHMCEEDAVVMEKKQESVLQKLGYVRE